MRLNNKGIFLPLVLFILLVLCFMGIALNKSALNEFRFTYRSVDHQRAQYIAEGLINAAMAEIRMEMNADGEIRDAFVNTKAQENFFKKISNQDDLVENLNTLLVETEDDARIDSPSFSIDELRADLSDPTCVNSDGRYGDWIKKLIITVAIRFTSAHGISRYGKDRASFVKKISQVYDVKVADVRPVGNRYAMMVARVTNPDKDFNEQGGHFFVCNDPEKALLDNQSKVEGRPSLGISIGNEACIDLFPEYFYHDEDGWDQLTGEDAAPENDLIKDREKANSPMSLIPGWADNSEYREMLYSRNTESFVPDNEPWERKSVFEKCGKKQLSNLTGHIVKADPEFKTDEFVHEKSRKDGIETGGNLLLRGGGVGMEEEDYYSEEELGEMTMMDNWGAGDFGYHLCGSGIKFIQFNHPKSRNTLFFNSGWDTGRTHLFYRNCSVPCPVFGKVAKAWKVLGYKAEGVMDTGSYSSSKPKEGRKKCGNCMCPESETTTSAALPTEPCDHHYQYWEPSNRWDKTDDAFLFQKNEKILGRYMVKKEDGKWSEYEEQAKDIDSEKNYKAKNRKNFDNITTMIKDGFRAGATRIVVKLEDDETLFDKKEREIWPEGVVEVKGQKNNSLNIQGTVMTPGCIISENALNILGTKPGKKSARFKIEPRLSLVTSSVVKIERAGETWAGICAKGVKCEHEKARIIGNLSVMNFTVDGVKQISGELIYDGILQDKEKYAVDSNLSGKDENLSAFVVTISPIPQEIVDWHNIEPK